MRSVKICENWFESLKALKKRERGEVAFAILEHAFDNKNHCFNGLAEALYKIIAEQCIAKESKQSTRRDAISKKHRFMVFERDEFTCQYCGRSAPDVALEVDHIIPLSKGGNNHFDNLTTSCKDCNNRKRAHVLGEQRKW